jgi:NAD(P)H dehydrogenase (quinone)
MFQGYRGGAIVDIPPILEMCFQCYQRPIMIVITGATGALNGSTVDHLLERVPADEVAVAVRDVARARRFAERGVEVRRGDYADPASLPAAFAGADQLLLVSSSDPGADAVALHRVAIEAAAAAGVGRILYTSHQGAAHDSPFRPARDHAATEDLLAGSGVAWTALRNGFYAHSLEMLAGPWRETGVIAVPADGPVSWTAREDAAEAAAVVLASDGAYDGPTTITAGEAVTFARVAELASELRGRPVELVTTDPEAWVADRVAAGQPEFLVRFTLGIYEAAAAGLFAGVDPLLGALLGREPRTVRELLSRPAAG